MRSIYAWREQGLLVAKGKKFTELMKLRSSRAIIYFVSNSRREILRWVEGPRDMQGSAMRKLGALKYKSGAR